MAKWVEHCLPFVVLLAVIFAYHYFTAIFLCVWLSCSVHKANDVIRKIVSQTACEPSELAAAVIFVGTNVALTLWLAGAQQLRALALMPAPAPEPLSVWQVAFSVAITDSLVRCCGVIPKLLIVAATMRFTSGGGSGDSKRRGSTDGSLRSVPGGCAFQDATATATAAGATAGAFGGCEGSSGGCGSGASSCSSRGSLELPGGAWDVDGGAALAGHEGCAGVCCARRTRSSGAVLFSKGPCGNGLASPRGPCAMAAAAVAAARRTSSSGASLVGDGASNGFGGAASPRPGRLAHSLGGGSSSAHVVARRRSRMLSLYDWWQAGYRALLPIPAWRAYFACSTQSPALSGLLAGAYLCFKAYGLFRRGQLLLLATRLVLRTGALYGGYLRKAEIAKAGEPPVCPICQDPCSSAIRLDCSHIFCEDCLAEWLEREPTCPMCRSNVKPPGLSFGDGCTTLLPQLF